MGTTVLVVTHEHELVREFSQRVITIDHGRVIGDSKYGADDDTSAVYNEDIDDYRDSDDFYGDYPQYPENVIVTPD